MTWRLVMAFAVLLAVFGQNFALEYAKHVAVRLAVRFTYLFACYWLGAICGEWARMA